MRIVFTHGKQSYVYDPALICTEQALIADEALQCRLDQQQSDEPDFNARLKAGATSWYWHCLAALLLPLNKRKGAEHVGAWSLAGYAEAQKFVRALPRETFIQQKECLSDFFTGIGRDSEYSAAWQISGARTRLVMSLAQKIATERLSAKGR